MNLTTKKQKRLPWGAASFCAVLSLMTMSTNLLLSVVTHTDMGGWAIPFLAFLPMCFHIDGVRMSRMQVEGNSLKQQVEERGTQHVV